MVPDPDLPSPVPAGAGAGAGDAGPGGKPDPTAPPSRSDDGGDAADKPARRYGFDKAAVRKLIEKRFKVYEERDALPGLDQSVLVAFFIMADREQIDRLMPELQDDLAELDPFINATLRDEAGETILVVTRRTEQKEETATRLPLILGIATIITLTLSGSIAWLAFEGSIDLVSMFKPRLLGLGFVTFALPFMFVFGVQTVARRLIARRHGVKLAGPNWIPVPPIVFVLSIGTFGSLVNPKQPMPNRRAMFDVAAAGPIAGFLAALPVVILGIMMTASAGVPVPDGGEMQLVVTAPDGTNWTDAERGLLSPFERDHPDDEFRAHNVTVTGTFQVAGRDYGLEPWQAEAIAGGSTGEPIPFTVRVSATNANGVVTYLNNTTHELHPGASMAVPFAIGNDTSMVTVVLEYSVPDQTTLELGMPLAYRALDAVYGDGEDRLMHPLGMAGWGILLTLGITLLPTGRFDGGAVARAALGERMAILSWATIVGVAVLWFFYPGWLYLVLTVLLFLGARHPGALNESTLLDGKRWVVLGLLVLLFVVTFVPIPAFLPNRGF